MDPVLNPFAPGAGTTPPELAGHDDLIERAAVAPKRISLGRSARSIVLHGLCGVGKTVLLNRIIKEAESSGILCARMGAPEGRSLPTLPGPALRATLLRLSRGQALKDHVQRGMKALAGLVGAVKLKHQDVELSLDFESEAGPADSGDLNSDLTDLFLTLGTAAQERSTAIVLTIDELQHVSEDQLAALITGLHRAKQESLPITMIAAGLPQLFGRTGHAKSHAERLFEFASVGRLDDGDARVALIAPAARERVEFDPDAVAEILRQTQGCPYFLKEWGKHSWDIADGPRIGLEDVKLATTGALAELDASFFRVRFDRLTPAQRRYLRAMAELEQGPHRSGDIAGILDVKVTAVAPGRSALIANGMIYNPAQGNTAFTVPLLDGFMKRTMPVFTAAR